MFITYIIIATVLALLLAFSGVGKLRHNPLVVHSVHEVVGVPMRLLPWLATAEFAGAAGLLIGIIWWPLGIAAAIGIIVYFIGAGTGHMRVKDFQGVSAPAVILLVAVAALVMRLLSL